MLPRMFIVTGMTLTVLLGVLTVMRATQSLATENGVLPSVLKVPLPLLDSVTS